VACNGKKAKIEIEPKIRVIYNHGLKEQEMKKALDTCVAYKDDFINEWNKRFG